MTETDRKARLERMATRLRKGAQVLEELALEVETLISEERTPGQQANDLVKWFGEQWAKRHGGAYVDGGAKDRVQVKRLLAKLSADEVQTRARRYFATDDPFVINARHPIGLFVTGINKWGEDAEHVELPLDVAAPRGCRHTPPCASDQAHTRRTMADMRGSARA